MKSQNDKTQTDKHPPPSGPISVFLAQLQMEIKLYKLCSTQLTKSLVTGCKLSLPDGFHIHFSIQGDLVAARTKQPFLLFPTISQEKKSPAIQTQAHLVLRMAVLTT